LKSSEDKPQRPPAEGRRWTSFVAAGRGLHEQGSPSHRLRVEHDQHTLLIHLSDEGGDGWTTIAVDRDTRAWSVAQALRQSDAARDAYKGLYRS
jgi:hypothetical protein